jgi:hypothetical protein
MGCSIPWLNHIIICFRCLLEKDPIAQRHVARIQKLRGTYDSMGNRVPPPPQVLAEAKERSHKRGRKKASDMGKPWAF